MNTFVLRPKFYVLLQFQRHETLKNIPSVVDENQSVYYTGVKVLCSAILFGMRRTFIQ